MFDKRDPRVPGAQVSESDRVKTSSEGKPVHAGLGALLIDTKLLDQDQAARKPGHDRGTAAIRWARGARHHYMPEFDPDIVSGGERDLLDIQSEVNALSALVAAQNIKPPLSIGLFGDWGMGKTFFMDKMYARVERISESGAKGFCSGIVQIRFNAWHYVEANLWASLIDTIFRNLEDAVLGREGGDVQLEALRARWQSALEDQRRAEKELAMVAKSLRAAEAERDRLLQEKEEAERKASEARDRGEESLPTVAEISAEIGRQLGPLLCQAGDELGLTEALARARDIASRPVDEALDTLSDVRLTGNRALQTWRAFATSGFTLKQLILGLIAVVMPMAMVALLAYVNGEQIREWLAQPMTVLAEIAVMVGTATQWARGRIRKANDVFDKIDDIRRKLVRARDQELEKRRQALADARARVDELARELAGKQLEVDSLMAKQQAARRELDEFTPARRMATFLSERVASNDYRKHLGLIALIRQDLQKLSELLALQDDEDEKDPSLPCVRRIVLYIDDLDRCPPNRVVELLQTIHLLLAFPLFVVVVAVDARWISQALIKHYPELLDFPDEDESSDQPTSYDYLEKIFQIPYWIRSMSPEASAQMMMGLLDGTMSEASVVMETLPEENHDSGAIKLLDAQRLEIRDDERSAMLALAAVAGRSPRAVKRFINVYRLIKASLPEQAVTAFEPGHTAMPAPDYLPTLMNLAVLVGYPHIADELFDELAEVQGSVSELIRHLQGKYRGQPDWDEFFPALDAFLCHYPELSLPMAQIRACAGRVSRYSFRLALR